MPKVTVIIPTYNCARYLPEAIDSVLNQTYKDFEIIVVDDGSKDNTQEIVSQYIEKYPNKIIYFYQNNQGPAEARNKGIKEAKGQYLAFLDSDDTWFPEKLVKQIRILNDNPGIDLVYASGLTIDINGNILGKKPEVPVRNVYDFLRDGRIPNMTVVIRKKCLEEVGLFDPTLKVGEDTDLWIRICSKFNCYYIDDPLAFFKKHDFNISTNLENMHKGHIVIYRKMKKLEVFKDKSKTLWNMISKEQYLLGKFYFDKKLYLKSVKYLFKALSSNIFLGRTFWLKKDRLVKKIFKLAKPYILFFINIVIVIIQIANKNNQKSKKINILFFDGSSGFGGSSNSLANLINQLNKDKFCPIVIIRNYGPNFAKIKNTAIIKLKNYEEADKISKLGVILYFFKNIIPESIIIFFIIKRKKIALVHINTNILSGTGALLAAQLAAVPLVSHIRETRDLIKREKTLANFVDKFIILNKKAYDIYIKYIAKEKLEIIYNGINLELFNYVKGALRLEYNLNSSPVVGLVGRIVKGKGHKEFILSAKEILKVKPNVKFVIVGDAKGDNGNYYAEIKGLVKNEDLENKVIFTGWRNDVENVIADLDILVQATTTYPEGLGSTMIEAMALKKPVVATDVPGSSEIVVDGVTGFLVPPGVPKILSEAISTIISDKNLSVKFGNEGRKRVEELFNIDKTAKKIEMLYMELLKKKV